MSTNSLAEGVANLGEESESTRAYNVEESLKKLRNLPEHLSQHGLTIRRAIRVNACSKGAGGGVESAAGYGRDRGDRFPMLIFETAGE